jgi:hypothetical protein
MHRESEMPGTFEDFIRQVGAPNSLFSDNSKVQIGKKCTELLRMYGIMNFQCEPTRILLKGKSRKSRK